MNKYKMVVLTNAMPGRDAEFNDWYTKEHIYDVIKTPGFTSAQRFKAVKEPGSVTSKFGYLAIYEVEAADLDAALADLQARYGTPEMSASAALDPNTYVMVCEALTPVVNNEGEVHG
jgi:hypothetical protein